MYRRIILKLSGETLAPDRERMKALKKDESPCYDANRIDEAAKALLKAQAMGVQLGIVLGGGNIWRGRFTNEMDAVSADQMGMLATILNALAMQEAILRLGGKARVFTPQEMTRFTDHYRADLAVQSMERGEIVLLAGGSGNPFFTTDTAAVLRAAELKADAVFKGTDVEGIFDADPRKVPDARLIADVTYAEVIAKGLKVMDATAFQLCMERSIPSVRVFNMKDLNNILRVIADEPLGTVAHP